MEVLAPNPKAKEHGELLWPARLGLHALRVAYEHVLPPRMSAPLTSFLAAWICSTCVVFAQRAGPTPPPLYVRATPRA